MHNDSDSLIEAAVEKIGNLSRQIPKLLEEKRVLENFVAQMRAISNTANLPSQAVSVPALTVNAAVRKTVATAKKPTKKLEVRQAIRAFLSENGKVSRKELLDHLIGLGLMGSEASPLKRLGTLLNMFKDEFESDGKGNYQLRPTGSSEPGTGLSKETLLGDRATTPVR